MTTPTLLSQMDHRPWPLPQVPWIMEQSWKTLLFAHWPVLPNVVQPYLPDGLLLDTFEGDAWIGIVPFEMGYRLRGFPNWVRFPELNVRTYVTFQGKPGVFFFSLDATARLSVQVARTIFALPYYQAQIALTKEQSRVHYHCQRMHDGTREARFIGYYEPVSSVYWAKPGTLEHWLTERYCFYAVNRQNQLCRAEVHHQPWPLQQAKTEIQHNSMSEIELPGLPTLLHYTAGVDVIVWPLWPVR